MKVFHSPADREQYRLVHGPADLNGRAGRLRVIHEDDDTVCTRIAWATAIGVFVLRGGEAASTNLPKES